MNRIFYFNEPPKRTPYDKMPDGPLSGNGDIGLALGCPEPDRLSFYLSKNDIWNSDSRWETPGIRGYGILSIRCPEGAGSFYAEQHLRSGTIVARLSGEWGEIQVDTMVLRNTNLIVQKISCLRALYGTTRIHVDLCHTSRGEEVQTQVSRHGGEISGRKAYEGPKYLWPLEARSLTKVMGKADLEFFLRPGESVEVRTALCTSEDGEDPQKLCRKWIGSDLELLTKAHEAWWESFWQESSVKLPCEKLLEDYWYVSSYIMACCTAPDKFAPGLFGSWITTDYPAWCGDYHLNYNYQAPFWFLYSSNHVSLTDCYDQPLLDYIPASQKAAREKLGCRGLYTLVGIGPLGLRTSALEDKNGNDDVNYWGQKSNAAYGAVNMIMRWRATLDEGYAQKVYPYLTECAAFWMDYLTLENGRYMDRDDCIIENSKMAVGVFEWAEKDVCEDLSGHVNPLLSMGLLRMLFRGLLDMYPEDSRREQWKHVLDHLPAFPTMEKNGKTVFRLTEEGLDWNKGNSLEIQHIYPVGCVGLGSKLLEIGRETHRQMGRWEDYNAFPTYFPAAARLGFPEEEICTHLREQIQKHSHPNGMLFFGGGGIECCSGVPATVNEMLLQSHEGIIRLFPVWKKDASFRDLRADGAFLISASRRGGRVEGIRIFSEKGSPCTLWLGENTTVKILCQGHPVPTEMNNLVCRFQTEPQKTYEVIWEESQ